MCFESHLSVEKNFQLNSNENLSTKEKILQNHIELIISKAMTFVLYHLKPWENLPVKEWSSYFNQNIQEDISIKELGDRLWIKIFFQDSKQVMLTFLK
jgi:hypothetical protein